MNAIEQTKSMTSRPKEWFPLALRLVRVVRSVRNRDLASLERFVTAAESLAALPQVEPAEGEEPHPDQTSPMTVGPEAFFDEKMFAALRAEGAADAYEDMARQHEEDAQEYNRRRDPGMANHQRKYAKAFRDKAAKIRVATTLTSQSAELLSLRRKVEETALATPPAEAAPVGVALDIPKFIRGWTAPFHVTMDGIKDAKGCWICSATNNKLAHELVELMNYAAARSPAKADTDAIEALHSCVCLLETMAEAAKERGDDAEWAMMSVMAENSRKVLAAGRSLLSAAPSQGGDQP